MSEINNTAPVLVTGEERRHPAIRTLARACIALARLRIAAASAATDSNADQAATSGEPTEPTDEERRDV